MAVEFNLLGGIQTLGNLAMSYLDFNNRMKIADFNAEMNEIDKTYADISAKVRQDRLRKEKESLVGRQIAAYSASGVLLDGSPLDVIADTIHTYEKDILFAGINADIEKGDLDKRATRNRAQSDLYETQQSATLLTNLTSNVDKFVKFKSEDE